MNKSQHGPKWLWFEKRTIIINLKEYSIHRSVLVMLQTPSLNPNKIAKRKTKETKQDAIMMTKIREGFVHCGDANPQEEMRRWARRKPGR